jgi:Ca2+-binding RTX toxin-like protein
MGRVTGGSRLRGGCRGRGGGHDGRTPLISAVALLCLALVLAAGPAVAKKITGSKRSELIVGTKKADRINGKGGNDLIRGKSGNDRLNGGEGSNKVVGGKGNDKVIGGPLGDTLVGGPGVDSHFGGPGNDLLNAADGRRDAVIDGGTGTNKCIIDTTLELSIVRGCGTIQAGGRGGQGGGGGGGGGGPVTGPGQGLRLISYACNLPVPGGCLNFLISGDGADEQTAGIDVVGGGGITNVLGLAGSLSPPDWNATGGFTCTGDGFLRVTIGSESVDVPVTCPTGLLGLV